MPGQTITLELPKSVWEWAERAASATQRPVKQMLVDSLAAIMPPPLDDVPDELREELAQLEMKTDADLRAITCQRLAPKLLNEYDHLLEKNSRHPLTAQEQSRLEQLRKSAERLMLMRARAFVLLQWRGYRLPTVGELEKQFGQTART